MQLPSSMVSPIVPLTKIPLVQATFRCIREMFGWREDCGSRADLWNEVEVNELHERRFEPEVKPDGAEQEPEGVCMKDAARGGRKLGQLLSG